MRIRTASLAILPLACGGCLSGYYVLPAANAPLFSEGGEIQATAGTTLHPPSLEANVAVSPVDHLGILASVSWTPVDHGNKHTYGELAIGGYLPLGGWRIELYGGVGYGTSYGPFGLGANWADSIRWSGDFTRTFAQLDAGYEVAEYLELGALFRMGWLTAWVSGLGQQMKWYQETKHELTGEWGLLCRVGWPMVKVESQILMSTGLGGEHEDDLGIVFAVLLGIHLAFDLW